MPIIKRAYVKNRLCWFRSDADENFWKKTWRDNFEHQKGRYKLYDRGLLDEYEPYFTKWLPKEGKIIEAGCGLCQYVIGLKARGYNVEGFDLDESSISMVKAIRPDLSLYSGDVRNLNVEDNHYDGYISLGVVEHVYEGPDAFIAEAYRVLKPGGIAIITVPWISPLRRKRVKEGAFSTEEPSLPFYQYAFDESEFTEILTKHNFSILETGGYSAFKGLKDETQFVQKMINNKYFGRKFTKFLLWFFKKFPKYNNKVGHMLLVVAQK